MSVRKHLLLLVAGVAMPLLLILGWAISAKYRDDLDAASTGALRLAQITAADSARFVAQTRALLEQLSRRPDVLAMAGGRCRAALVDIGSVYEGLAGLTLWRGDGSMVCTTYAGVDPLRQRLPHPELREQALRLDGIAMSPPMRGPLSGHWGVILAHPVRDGRGLAAGLLTAQIDLEEFQPVVTRADLPKGTVVLIFDESARIVAQTADPSRIGKPARGTHPQQMLRERSGILRTSEPFGIDQIAGFTPVAGTDWIAVASVPAEALLADAQRQRLLLVALAAAATLLAILTALHLAGRISRPIDDIAAAARRIAAGQRDVRVQANGPQEIALVGSELDRMLQELHSRAQRVERLTWIYATLSETDQAIVRATDRDSLFRRICEICVTRGHARIAVVRLLEDGRLTAAEHATQLSHTVWALDAIELDAAKEHGLYAEALRTGEACFSNDDASDPRFARWGEVARRNGIRGTAALPFTMFGKIVGVLGVHVGEKDFFDDEIRSLLREIANDLSFALETLERDRRREQAESAVRATSERFRRVFNLTPEPMSIFDLSSKTVIDANQSMLDFYGCTRADVVGVPPQALERFWMTDAERVSLFAELRAHGLLIDREVRYRHADGSPRIALVSMIPLDPPASEAAARQLICVMRDVTGLKKAERTLQDANARLHALSVRLLEVQESERTRIARELHDEIGQALTAIKIRLQVLARDGKPPSPERIAAIVELVDDALMQVRLLSQELRPPQLDDLGLAAALRALLNRVLTPAGFLFRLEVRPPELRPSDAVSVACYRITQESLTNVLRHSRGSCVDVALEQSPDGTLQLEIRDDGAGFDAAALRERALHGESTGLLGMEERARLAGGTMRIESRRGAGTRIVVSFAASEPAPALH